MDKTGWSSKVRHSAVMLAALAMVACGGGGSKGPSEIDVTAENRDTLAHAAALAVQGGVLTNAAGDLTALTRDTALRAARAQREGPKAVYGPVPEFCDVSGRWLLTWNDSDNNFDLSVGDVLTVDYESCEDVAGELMNGRVALTLTAASMTGFGATASFTNWAVSAPARQHSATYNGSANLSVSETSPTTGVVTLSVPRSLQIQATSPTFEDTVTLRSGYETRSQVDTAAATSTTTVSGDIVSAKAGGLVEISTLVPIVQEESAAFPREGAVQVLGRTGSLKLTALGGDQVRVEADYDGDGTVNDAFDETWDWLL